jgi:hypothetical protein
MKRVVRLQFIPDELTASLVGATVVVVLTSAVVAGVDVSRKH